MQLLFHGALTLRYMGHIVLVVEVTRRLLHRAIEAVMVVVVVVVVVAAVVVVVVMVAAVGHTVLY